MSLPYCETAWVSVPNIPNGSTPIWNDLFLTSDNKLITAGGSVVGTGVGYAGQADRDTSGNTTLPLVGTNGVAAMLRNGAWVSIPNVPNGSKPIWNDLYLTSDNKLVTAGGSTVGTGLARRDKQTGTRRGTQLCRWSELTVSPHCCETVLGLRFPTSERVEACMERPFSHRGRQAHHRGRVRGWKRPRQRGAS